MDWLTFWSSVIASLVGSSALTVLLQHVLKTRSVAKQQSREADARTMNLILKHLTYSKCQWAFAGRHLESRHKRSLLNPLWEYLDSPEVRDRKLVDCELENLRLMMFEAAETFAEVYSKNLFPIDSKSEWMGYSDRWDYELIEAAKREVVSASWDFCDKYKQLHDAAREKLGTLIREENDNG